MFLSLPIPSATQRVISITLTRQRDLISTSNVYRHRSHGKACLDYPMKYAVPVSSNGSVADAKVGIFKIFNNMW